MQGKEAIYKDNNVIVREVSENNRGLFAQKGFKPWETVVKAEPIATSVLSSIKDKYCNYCFQPKDLVKCGQCKFMYYCSKECQKSDWVNHKLECKTYSKMVNEKGLSPLKQITAQFALNLSVYFLRKKDEKIDQMLKEMVDLLDVQTPQKKQFFQEICVVMMENLGLQKSPQVMSDLMKQISTVSLNGFTIQDYMCSVQAIGPGLYYPLNFINHDCHPNCTQIYDGRIIKIVANRFIEPNEEITISYTPALDDYENKRKVCREGYLFQCFCEFCQVNKMYDWSTFYLLCPSCKKKTLSRTQKKQIVCKECEEVVNEQIYRKITDEILNNSEIIGSLGTDYKTAKKSLFAIKKIVDFSSPQFQPLLQRVYIKAIEQGMDNPKMYEEAYILLKEMIANMPKWYRIQEEEDIPYPYVWKYAEMGKLCYNLNKKKKAVEFTEKSFDILKKIGFKSQPKELKQMEQRMTQLNISMSFGKAEAFRKS